MNSKTLAISFLVINPAAAAIVAIEFDLEFNTGYSMQGQMSFDDTFSVVFAEGRLSVSASGNPENIGIDYLAVQFFDPSGSSIGDYSNILGGAVLYEWLSVEYDVAMMQFGGFFDVGADSNLSLEGEFFASNAGELENVALDSALDFSQVDIAPFSSINVRIVPEPSTSGLVYLFGVLLLLLRRRRMC